MRGSFRRLIPVILAGLFAVGTGALGAEPLDTFRQADLLFQQGRGAEACRTLYASLSTKATLTDTVQDADRELLLRLGQSSVEFALEAAGRGDRSTAINASTAGLAISRQIMERPNVSCDDVATGIDLWLLSEKGLEQVWRIVGSSEDALEVAADRDGMDRFARSVILPRCERLRATNSRRADLDVRVEQAEARALVRMWAWHLVRIAADNIG